MSFYGNANIQGKKAKRGSAKVLGKGWRFGTEWNRILDPKRVPGVVVLRAFGVFRGGAVDERWERWRKGVVCLVSWLWIGSVRVRLR